jgi:hypothetical protein
MRQFSLSFAVLVLMLACKPVTNRTDAPLLLLDDAGMQLLLTPAAAPVETPLMLILSAEQVIAVTGELNGVSMYMGRIPLQFTLHNGQWQAEFFLGACSDPAMLWQVQLEMEFADGEKRSLKQQFHSSW